MKVRQAFDKGYRFARAWKSLMSRIAFDADEGWYTSENGQHYHVGSSGEIDKGMGGRFNGQKVGKGKQESAKPNSSGSGRTYRDTDGNPVPKISSEKLKSWSDDDLRNDIAKHESWLRSYSGKEKSRRDVKENIPFVRSWLQDKKMEAKRRGLKL